MFSYTPPQHFSTNHRTTAAGGAGADASAVGATPIATITGHQGPVWQVGLVIVEWCGWMDGWAGGCIYDNTRVLQVVTPPFPFINQSTTNKTQVAWAHPRWGSLLASASYDGTVRALGFCVK